MLEVRDVTLRRDGRPILDGVTLGVRPGEVVAILGPNGAGKSTLLHVLSGALTPDGGTALLDGQPLGAVARAVLARRRAVLPQASVLSFPFRVRDVVRLGRGPHEGRGSRAAHAAAVEAAMGETEVRHLADRVYTTLSGGERQRVQLARVLAQIAETSDDQGARYLLLDEPTNALDLSHQQSCLSVAGQVARRGGGVVAVLHDPNLAALHADRIVVVRDGRVAAMGTPEAVLTPATLRRTYGMEVIVGRHPSRGCPTVYPA